MFSNGEDKDSDLYIKLDKECMRASIKIAESVLERKHKNFHYWHRALEILCKQPELLWVESKEAFLTESVENPDPYDSALMVILYNKSLE